MPDKRFLILLLLIALSGGYGVHALTARENPFPPSPMVGEKAPRFSLAAAVTTRPGLGSANLSDGQPKLLNIFASWCLPCQAEAPQLQKIADAGYRIDGVATRDSGAGVARFINRHGNPYARIGLDPKGTVQRSLRTSGVPESFVVAGDGTILYHHVGDIRAEHVPDLIGKLRSAR